MKLSNLPPGVTDAIIEDQVRETEPSEVQAMDAWIACSERLPPTGESVLVWYGIFVTKERIRIMHFVDAEAYPSWCDEDGRGYGQPPTHWQPLPEPPK